MCRLIHPSTVVSRTRDGACSLWQWWHWWWGFTQPFIHPAEPGQSLHHILQLRQYVKILTYTPVSNMFIHVTCLDTLLPPHQRWWGSRLQGHGYRDHQQWGRAGVPSDQLLQSSGDAGDGRRWPHAFRKPHGRPSYAEVLPGFVHPGQPGGPAQHRPRGLPELSVAGHGGWMVCDAQINRSSPLN